MHRAARCVVGDPQDTVATCGERHSFREIDVWSKMCVPIWDCSLIVSLPGLGQKYTIIDHFPIIADKGWELLGVGAYFAYLKHPYAISSDQLAKKLVDDAAILTLPGTMFVPALDESGKSQIRIAFANINVDGIKVLFDRIAQVTQ